jgi:hypothetical protein
MKQKRLNETYILFALANFPLSSNTSLDFSLITHNLIYFWFTFKKIKENISDSDNGVEMESIFEGYGLRHFKQN